MGEFGRRKRRLRRLGLDTHMADCARLPIIRRPGLRFKQVTMFRHSSTASRGRRARLRQFGPDGQLTYTEDFNEVNFYPVTTDGDSRVW